MQIVFNFCFSVCIFIPLWQTQQNVCFCLLIVKSSYFADLVRSSGWVNIIGHVIKFEVTGPIEAAILVHPHSFFRSKGTTKKGNRFSCSVSIKGHLTTI